MAVNRGKKFEDVVREAFESVPNVSIDRLHDQTTGYKGSTNICDFIVYREPYLHYIECKSVHGNTLSIHSVPKQDAHGKYHGFYGNISDRQWNGLSEKSLIEGVVAGVLCWWIDRDITKFLPINSLQYLYRNGAKSVRFDLELSFKDNILHSVPPFYTLTGKKKRIFWEYDMEEFLNNVPVIQSYCGKPDTH